MTSPIPRARHSEIDLGADGPATLSRLYRVATIPGTRRVVARQVCEPLETLHERGVITDAQYEAGRRLRTYLAGSWPAERCTARWNAASDPSEYDEDEGAQDEDAKWQQRAEFHALWRQAERLMGAACWAWVRPVLEGTHPGSLFRGDVFRAGLSVLVREWRITA